MNIQDYLESGYYIGKTNEIIKEMETFEKIAEEVREHGKDYNSRFRKGYKYRFQYPQSDEENKRHWVTSLHEIEERQNHIKKNNYRIIQKWWEKGGGGDFEKHTSFFRDTLNSFLPKIYPDLQNNIKHHDAFTIYDNGDFIKRHSDGRSPERYCVVLIYLSDKKDYIDGGGHLVVGRTENELEKVEPVIDNFVIMDFLNHDIIHEVEPVKNDFHRFTYLSFVYNEELFYKEELNKGKITEEDMWKFHSRAAKKIFKNSI